MILSIDIALVENKVNRIEETEACWHKK